MIFTTVEKILTIICIVLVIVCIVQSYIFNRIMKGSKVVGGIELGSNFETVCFIDETDTRIILDRATSNLYIANDEGITYLMDEKGKPLKYDGFGDLAKKGRKEDAWSRKDKESNRVC